MNKVKDLLKKNTMLIALVIVAVFFGVLTNGTLFVPQNVNNLIAQNAYVVILAVGMLMCILTGGNIDLAVGSSVCLIGAIAGKLLVSFQMNMWLAVMICLLCGVVIGAWQGFWIAFVRIPAFIVTLSGMLLFRGLALILLDGLNISPFPEQFTMLFNSYIANPFGGSINIMCMLIAVILCVVYIFLVMQGRIRKKKKGYHLNSFTGEMIKLIAVCVCILAVAFQLARYEGIPTILVLLGIVVVVYSYYTSSTVNGRYLYAVGGNEKAAGLSGVNTERVFFKAYMNMGFLSAVAALVCVARFNAASGAAGQNYELDAIGACYIGGASAYGGIGTVAGAVIGAVFMGVLNNGMSIMGIDTNIQRAVKGLVLLAAVAFDVISKRKSK